MANWRNIICQKSPIGANFHPIGANWQKKSQKYNWLEEILPTPIGTYWHRRQLAKFANLPT
jgi:hypothetical protein